MLVNGERAKNQMCEAKLDALIATSPINVTYFSGYACWLDPLARDYMFSPGTSNERAQQNFAVFTAESVPALVVHAIFAVNAIGLSSVDLHLYGAGTVPGTGSTCAWEVERRVRGLLRDIAGATPVEALVHLLRDRGLTGARIGVEMEGLRPDTRAALQRRLPQADLRDCTNLIRLIRMVKSEEELQRLTRAAQVNETAAMETLGIARPGVRTPELVASFRALAAREGADFDHFAFSPRGWGIAMELDYTLQAGEVLYVDFGCIYEHYFSDSGTTLALGDTSPEFDGKHAAVSAAIEAGMEALRPAAKASDVRAAMWRAMEEHGVTNSDPHGHSLGLEVREYPILVPNNGLRIRDGCVDVSSDLPLEAGMVLNLECAVLEPGQGSVHMERSFVVTTSGCRPLVPQERSQPVRPEPV